MDAFPSAPNAPPGSPDETIRRLMPEFIEARDQYTARAEFF